MNKNFHRIVFNAARGMRMVVQETARSAGKASGATPAVAAGALSALLMGVSAHAQIVASPTAPPGQRPVVLVAPNGVPLVNIQTPTAAGVSRNVFTQFDVMRNGAILNNSRTNVQTQLGGYVQGNPWLARGAARVIVNEVNGGNPSQLRGMIEVGGQRAEVIIANPAGIDVQGAGFINANRATLTTGLPQYDGMGGLDSFVVRSGTVTINGAGLDVSSTDYAAILARAVQVNAGIWASELKVVTGANQISADHSQVSATPGTGPASSFALDVAALGGMYANKITLIGTEAGLGARNAGNIGAGAGGLVVTAAGRLENTGTLEGPHLELTTSGDIVNRGGTIRQTGAVALTLMAPTLNNTNGATIAAEPVVASAPAPVSSGTTTGSAPPQPAANPASAPVATPAGVGPSTPATSITPTYAPPAPGFITAGGSITNDGGHIYAGGPIALNAPQVNNAGGTLSVATMSVTGPNFSNAGGTLDVSQSFGANVGRFDNTGGKINVAAGGLGIATSADLLNTDGTLTSAGDVTLSVGGQLDNTRGKVTAPGALTATVAGAVTNASGTLAANQALVVGAGSLDNTQGSIQSTQAGVRLNVANTLGNAKGSIAAATDLSVHAGSLTNTGSLRGGNDAALGVSGQLSNDGSITAARHVSIAAGSVQAGTAGVFGAGVQADGKLGTTGDLSVRADGSLTAHGTLIAAGNATLQGASVDVSASQTSASNIAMVATQSDVNVSKASVVTPGTLSITANSAAAQTLINTGGKLNAKQLDSKLSNLANTADGEIVQTGTGATTIAMGGMLDNSGGRIASNGQDLALQAATMRNADGKIEHAGPGTLSLAGASFTGTKGQITTNGALTVAMTGAFAQDSGSTSAKRITIDAGALSNRGGQIVQTGTEATRISVAGALDNNAGTIASNGATSVAAGSLTNQSGTVRAAGASDLNLRVAGALDNSAKGEIGASGNANVAAGRIDNSTGRVTAAGDLAAHADGALINASGTLAANGRTDLNAGTLDNRSGTVAAVKGDLAVTTQGATDNDAGSLQAAGKVALRTGDLSNAKGKVFGDSLSVDTAGHALDNTQGTLAATTTVNLQSGALTNDAGLIQSGKAMVIDTHGQALSNTHAAGYSNQQGGITSADTLDLTTGAVNNAGGFIGAKNALNARTQAFSNTAGGIVLGQSGVTIDAGGAAYDNSGGQTLATRDLQLHAATVTNTGGLIRSTATTTIDAGNVGNTGTLGTNQGIEGQSVVVRAGNVDNTSGAIRADVDATLTSGGTVNNTGGLMSAKNALTLQDPNAGNPAAKTLSLINTSGTLIADKRIAIDAANFSAEGKIASGRDLSIALKQDITNNAELSASGDLSYTTMGKFTNNAKLLAGQTLTVGGNIVENTTNAEMSGMNTLVHASDTLSNRGVIDSRGDTRIDAGTVSNIGTGRIYGDDVSIATGTLNNDTETANGVTKAGSIAARRRLDIGAGTITNREHSLIFSGGDMAIGGGLDGARHATGQGGVLDNLSADVESLGNMTISMGQVNNRDVHIRLGTPIITPSMSISYSPGTPVGNGVMKMYDQSEIRVDRTNKKLFLKHTDGTEEQIGANDYATWTNVYSTSQATAADIDPAHLIAGGNMNVNGRLLNQDSQVLAGGTLVAPDYVPVQLTGEVTTTGVGVGVNTGGIAVIDKNLKVPPVTIKLGAYKYVSNLKAVNGQNLGTAPLGTSQGGAGGSGDVNAGNRPDTILEVPANVGAVRQTSGHSVDSSQGAKGPRTAGDLTSIGAGTGSTDVKAHGPAGGTAKGTGVALDATAHGTVDPTAATTASSASRSGSDASQTIPMVVRTTTANLHIPTASLFNIHPAGSYLIETDPRFANYRNWLSSDYLLNNLGADPNTTLKRLGDGFYEQKLIREQVAKLTGYRYLDGFTSDEDQYTALMTDGATFAKQYGLRPGVALSAAQMAQLTSDIVWLVEQSVTLPDGSTQRVLVPQVYVRVRPGDIDGSGALLSADATVIKSKGDLVNTGTIAGRSLVSISAQNIDNLGGRISGGSVKLDAVKDLNNIGGTIDGRDAVALIAGKDINIRSTTQSSGTTTNLDQIAGVYVSNPGGILLASAGRDVNVNAAVLANTGAASRTLISAGHDVNLGTVTESRSTVVLGGGKNSHIAGVSTQSTEIGSRVLGGGSVAITAGNDIRARAADVSAGGTLALSAEHDIRIDAGQATSSNAVATSQSSKSLFKKSSSSTFESQSATQVLGSNLSGKDVVLSAGNDLQIRGSNVSAADQLALSAGRDVRIESAQEQSTVAHQSQSSKSGLSLSLASGLSYGSGSKSHTDSEVRTTQIGSTLSGGNVSIDAGRDAQIIASNVLADKNIAVTAGRNIDVRAAQDTSATADVDGGKNKSIGLIHGLAPRQTLYGKNQAAENGTSQSSTAVTSLLSANGGNLTMVAGLDPKYAGTGQGNITTEGADLLAKNKVTLSANAVNLNAATSSGISTQHAESKSHTIGAQLAGTVGGVITRAYDMAQESRKTDDSRLKGALELKAGYDAYKVATDPGLGDALKGTTATGTGGDPGGAAFGVSVSESRSRSRSDSADAYSTQRGTNIQAGSIDVTARETDITTHGAKLQARDIALDAKRDINLLAAENTAATLSTNSGHTLGGGVTFGAGSQNGFSIQLNASQSKGNGNGSEVHDDNTLITGTDSVKIKSGRDVNMIGAQVAGEKVKADVGRNLNIQTLQDTSNYTSKQSSSGLDVSLCIPPICVGQYVTGDLNASKQKVDHAYQSATGQSGIAAGKGGFDVTVKGNTDLVGAGITSAAPVDKNSLVTGSLTTRDLENRQKTHSSSDSIGLSYGSSPVNTLSNVAKSATSTALSNLNGGKGLPGNDNQISHTLSVISAGNIKITGTGDKALDEKSRENVATLTGRDPVTANEALVNTLTLQQAKEIPKAQQQAQERQRAAQLVGSVVDNVIGDVSHSLNQQAQAQENARAAAAGEAPRTVTTWTDGSPEKTHRKNRL